MPSPSSNDAVAARWLSFAFVLGLSLTFHGYHSLDGDQAYRLPLLLHRQDPTLYADDPFVRAFDAFNPHRGYLALLDVSSRAFGLSVALAALYVLTYVVLCVGIDRIARAVWPCAGPWIGTVAVGLMVLAKAGNIGTNHLFEPVLLDRGIGFALGWVGISCALGSRGGSMFAAALAIGLAALVHPAVGLQLALVLGTGWFVWGLLGSRTGATLCQSFQAIGWIGVCLVPAVLLQAGQSAHLFEGLPAEEFRILSAYVQSPQHMMPHLWRSPQWLAWGCYFVWALLALASQSESPPPAARIRLAILLAVNLVALAGAWVAIELVHDLRVTLFQPFRMATVARGLCLISAAHRALNLWQRGCWDGKVRALLLAVGLTGDWPLVVATVVELAATGAEALLRRCPPSASRSALGTWAIVLPLVVGLAYVARHDPERGHERLIVALVGLATLEVLQALVRRRLPPLSAKCIDRPIATWRLACGLAVAWAMPSTAFVATALAMDHPSPPRWIEALARRCRFFAIPVDDIERLAIWCRDHTPRSARFIGPPGPKTFRLWSRRALAFNRASVPYRAAGLADWFARFQDHVGFEGNLKQFVHAYLNERQHLERGYDALDESARAALALRQGAEFVIAAAPKHLKHADPATGPLELLHIEGRYAVYRIREPAQMQPVALGDKAPGNRR
jgi:hypothetical protein